MWYKTPQAGSNGASFGGLMYIAGLLLLAVVILILLSVPAPSKGGEYPCNHPFRK